METTTDQVPQSRLVRTEIPGPRSRRLMDRRSAAIPAGVGTTLGVFVARAEGGIVEDVDGNRLIDLARASRSSTSATARRASSRRSPNRSSASSTRASR